MFTIHDQRNGRSSLIFPISFSPAFFVSEPRRVVSARRGSANEGLAEEHGAASGAMIERIQALMQAVIEFYEGRIAELEGRLGKTPQNSSLPPSSQHPHAKPPRVKGQGRKKKRGGQPGHPKHERALIPSKECDAVVPLKPLACRRCGEKLNGADPEPLRHQVWELPEIKPLVTEYQQHRLNCPCCGESTCAPLPAGVPAGQSGPRLIAFSLS
jgi:hypothetical protein